MQKKHFNGFVKKWSKIDDFFTQMCRYLFALLSSQNFWFVRFVAETPARILIYNTPTLQQNSMQISLGTKILLSYKECMKDIYIEVCVQKVYTDLI